MFLFYCVNVKCVFWIGLMFMFCKVCEFSCYDEKLCWDVKFGSVELKEGGVIVWWILMIMRFLNLVIF